MPIFKLVDVTHQYKSGQYALSGINLSIYKGESLVLLGPNGCGKSTLQKILAGLIVPTAGCMLAFGYKIDAEVMRDSNFASIYRRKIGLVFQNSEVQLFCTNVLDEIMFGPLAMGFNYEEAEGRALELMEFVGIRHLAERMPHHLSGGEKKKVAIAAMLANNPEVIIMDEPTNGLDPRTQRWLLHTIRELGQRGKTVIIATHQLELVPQIADRVIIINEDHKVTADGLPNEILTNQKLLAEANLIDLTM